MTSNENSLVKPETAVVVEPDWLVPLDRPPIPRGTLVVENGKIDFVGNELPSRFHSLRRLRLNRCALLPALINAHCHLEFSDLQSPFLADRSFPDWIRSVMKYRAAQNLSDEDRVAARIDAIQKGMYESYANGVRAIVDMVTAPWDPPWIESIGESLRRRVILEAKHPALVPVQPLIVHPCIEVVDVSAARREQTLGFALDQLRASDLHTFNFVARSGLAPHASYTASVDLVQELALRCHQDQRIMSLHLAESRDELQWIANRSGEFESMLLPFLDDEYFAHRRELSEFVECMTLGWRSIIAHGNYLDNKDLSVLARNRHHVAIAHCPRTFKHFEHKLEDGSFHYPMQERLEHNVQHLVGTDSRASNPDLQLWKEVQALREEHPGISSETILRMVTIDAIDFLQLHDRVGLLREGAPSSLSLVQCDSELALSLTDRQLYDALLRPDTTSRPL